MNIANLFRIALLIATLAFGILAHSQVTFGLTAGWNLLANSSAAPIDIAATFGDSSKINTVWKWNKTASRWAFYAPSMTASTLATYSQAKGYDVLTSIASKEGFWVNASTVVSINGPAIAGVTLAESDLQLGWNLVGSADNRTPSQLNQALNISLGAASKGVTSIWGWDKSTSKWRFYAPSLDAQGGTALSAYITSKGYEAFDGAISANDGMWVNVNSSIATRIPVLASSYENKIEAGKVLGPVTTSNYYNAIAFADFFGDKTYSMVVNTLEYDNTKPISAAINGHIYFYKNVNGQWIDNTSSILSNNIGCIHPRKALVADFNGDGKPDVFFICHGYDGDNFPGENPHVLLSQPDGTYSNVTLPVTCFCHGGSAADFDGNGFADVVVTDTSVANQPFFLKNNKDGSFSKEITRVPTSIQATVTYGSPIYSLELIDFNGDGKYDLWFGSYYDPTQSVYFTPSIFINPGNDIFTNVTATVLPMILQKTLPLDIIYQNGKIYMLEVLDQYAGVSIEKIDYQTLTAKQIYFHNTPYSNGSTWFDWIIQYNGNIVPMNSVYGITVPQ